jgi:uncharacterized protein YyaL (SSP411 family)
LFGEEGEAFYMTGKDVTDMPLRAKNKHDSALPSGNAIAAMVDLRLSSLLENDEFRQKADDVLGALSGEVKSYPSGFTALLCAELLRQQGLTKIVIVNGDGADDLMEPANTYHPFADFAVCGKGYEELSQSFGHFENYMKSDCEGAAYICDMQGCRPPARETESLYDALKL